MTERAADSDFPYPRPAYAWYVVTVLYLAYVLAFVDREIIALMIKDIKASLQLSDWQISWLLGLAFAAFYTFIGIFLGWLADRSHRKWLLFAGITVWSAMTCACGMAGTFPALFLARIGVGAGEGALNPSALPMIKDYFPPDKVGRATGFYTAGVSSGSGIAFILGGGLIYPALLAAGPQVWPLVGQVEPWQQMFLYVGLPGTLVALLVLTVREPVRREFLRTGGRPQLTPAIWETLAFLFQRWRTYIVLFLALSVLAIMNYGVGYWIPEFLRRTYHLDNATWGHYVALRGVITVISGLFGVLVGGWACDILKDKYQDGYIRVCLVAFVLMMIGYSTFTLMPSPMLALMMLIPASVGAAAPTAAGAAAVLAISPPHMRSQITAFYYFVLNVIGLTVGPPSVAAMTDFYFHDESQLRYSIAVVASFFAVIGLLLLIYNRRHFRTGIEEAKAWA
jgi:MFS family permease